jgi:hypothetical protein
MKTFVLICFQVSVDSGKKSEVIEGFCECRSERGKTQKKDFSSGLPDGLFSNQKSQFG